MYMTIISIKNDAMNLTEPRPNDEQLDELAYAAIELYALPANLDLKLINLSENATFVVRSPSGKRWALRIHRQGYHSKLAIASELQGLKDLRKSDVAITPIPVKGLDGEMIQTISHPNLPHTRHVVLFEWETGAEPSMSQNLIPIFNKLGEATARLHLHSKNWQRPPWFTRLTWDFETSLGERDPHWGRWRDGMAVDAAKEKLFERTVIQIGKRLKTYGKSSDRFGLIHGDLRLANLLVDDNRLKIIDFDDCGIGWYMYDAATPISFYEHEPQVPELIEAWIEGYRRAKLLSKEDETEIPTFIMLRRLLLVAWIGSHHQTDLAKSMGKTYTDGSVELCEKYLKHFS